MTFNFFFRCAGTNHCNFFDCNCDRVCASQCGEKKRSVDDDPLSKFSVLDSNADGLISFDEATSHVSLQKRDTQVNNAREN